MSINYLAICGRLGRYTQLLKDAREALQEAYAIHKESVAKYDECLKYANMRRELCEKWARDAQKERDYWKSRAVIAEAATAELDHWKIRALTAEAENFTIKNNR
jgi:hypothetical protein